MRFEAGVAPRQAHHSCTLLDDLLFRPLSQMRRIGVVVLHALESGSSSFLQKKKDYHRQKKQN
jgi:hypothetical protein